MCAVQIRVPPQTEPDSCGGLNSESDKISEVLADAEKGGADWRGNPEGAQGSVSHPGAVSWFLAATFSRAALGGTPPGASESAGSGESASW